MSAPIVVSAVVLWSASGDMLLVRKRGTARFMHPGGKPEPGETPRAAAHREVAEELGLSLADEKLHELGQFEVAAANEPGRRLHASVFEYQAAVRVNEVRAELEELRWLAPEELEAHDDLAPLVAPVVRAARGVAHGRSR